MKRILWLLALVPALAFGQAQGPFGVFGGPIPSTSLPAPTTQAGAANSCAFTTDQGLVCSNGSAWVAVSASASASGFNTLTSGTNTAAAMVIGTGASLSTIGTGSINASTLGGATFASPGTIGGTTPGAASFTNLTIANSGNLLLGYITGSTKCLHVDTSGNVTGTSSDCSSGSGTVSSGASGDLAYYSSTGTTVSQLPIGTGLAISNSTLVPFQSINAQAGTSYTIQASDAAKLVTFSNASAIAVTLPQATGSFGTGYAIDVQNLGAGLVTITPTTSTINGAATLTVPTNTGCSISSDGTNYQISACNAITRTVATGGTGLTTLTAHGVLLGEGTSNVGSVAAMAADTLLQGQGTSADPASVALTSCSAAGNALTYNTSTHAFGCNSIAGATASSAQSFTFASIAQATTDYVAPFLTAGATLANFNALFPYGGTVKNLYIYAASAPASTQTFTFTIFTGTAGAVATSGITCQITAGNHTCNDTTDTATVSAGQAWNVQVITSATSGSTGNVAVGFEYDHS